MKDVDPAELDRILARIHSQVAAGSYRITLHAHAEMVEQGIGLEEVLEALRRGEILEHYPEHRRGACCLVSGATNLGRPLHVVCTAAQALLILITVNEPKPPKWVTPDQRRNPL